MKSGRVIQLLEPSINTVLSSPMLTAKAKAHAELSLGNIEGSMMPRIFRKGFAPAKEAAFKVLFDIPFNPSNIEKNEKGKADRACISIREMKTGIPSFLYNMSQPKPSTTPEDNSIME
jgi:hypothetical protein